MVFIRLPISSLQGLVWFTDFNTRKRKVVPFLCLISTNSRNTFLRDGKVGDKTIPSKTHGIDFFM
ncbi:hypothetical protein LguiA_014007 [Lonicera macranthoides]